MDKQTLVQNIQNMGLDADFEQLLLAEVDESATIDEVLIQRIADLLDAKAEYLDKSADLIDEQAEIFEDFEEDLKRVDELEEATQAEVLLENQQTLLSDMEAISIDASTKKQDEGKIDQIQSELSAQISQLQNMPTPPAQTVPPELIGIQTTPHVPQQQISSIPQQQPVAPTQAQLSSELPQ